MDEIDVTARGDAFIERAGGVENGDTIPADLRDFNRGMVAEAADVALENAQTRLDTLEFLASFEKCLVADTDAQKGFARVDELQERRIKLLATDGGHTVVEGAHAGQYDRLSLGQFLGFADSADIRAQVLESFLDTVQVARTVINKCYQSELGDRESGLLALILAFADTFENGKAGFFGVTDRDRFRVMRCVEKRDNFAHRFMAERAILEFWGVNRAVEREVALANLAERLQW